LDACPAILGPTLERFGVFISTLLFALNVPSAPHPLPSRPTYPKIEFATWLHDAPPFLYRARDEILACAESVYGILTTGQNQLLQRAKAGLERSEQACLIEIALDMVMQDIKAMLEWGLRRLEFMYGGKVRGGVVNSFDQEQEVEYGSLSCRSALPFLKFMVELRSESIEARIWKYLIASEEEGFE